MNGQFLTKTFADYAQLVKTLYINKEVFALLAIFPEFHQRQYHFSQIYPRISLVEQTYARVMLNFPTD